jgi:branched-subunit amino acid transport protein
MVLLAIVLTGIGTYFSRAIFILLLADQKFPPLAMRALEYVGPAVMGALVVTMLIDSSGRVSIGAPELAGLFTAVVIAARTRRHIATLIGGMTVFWLVGALLG